MEVVENEKCKIFMVDKGYQVVAFSPEYYEKNKEMSDEYYFDATIEDIFKGKYKLDGDIWIFHNGFYVFHLETIHRLLSFRVNQRLGRVDFEIEYYNTNQKQKRFAAITTKKINGLSEAIKEAIYFSRNIEPIEYDEKKDKRIYANLKKREKKTPTKVE